MHQVVKKSHHFNFRYKDHLCNRYCGGSHTVTTPEQRVMRVGHFMEQWGPEIAPLNEVLVKGTDGHVNVI